MKRMNFRMLLFLGVFLGIQLPANLVCAQREVIPLDGQWTIEESVEAEAMPVSFTHIVPVPGLVHQAKPAFPDVDDYESHEFIYTMKRYGILPQTKKNEGLGRTRQNRNFFWYKRIFSAPSKKQSAVLVINKAQFGTAVWLNGKKIGEHLGCFTASRFQVADALNWNGENHLVVRIGAHPGALPDWAFYGTDGEKPVWTPGIYDDVSLILANSPAIESIQVAPRITSSEIVVQTQLKNPGPACVVELSQQVKTWKGQQAVGKPVRLKVKLMAGEEKTITQTVPVPDAKLWSPEDPFLYTVESNTGGDNCTTRFGMRELRFDTPTKRCYLNGKIYFWRGASITLHRFFGDPLCQGQPFDEAWVRKLLIEIPKQMNWNAFRICIGPVPQKWLDIADEAGILLQYEFPIWDDRWDGSGSFRHTLWKEDDITEQVREFMRDNWNHPSVVLWDVSNETGRWNFLADNLVPKVRGLDLSKRPFDNGYSSPEGPDDPYEVHPYQTGIWARTQEGVTMTHLEKLTGSSGGSLHSGHAVIINEYGWLWLHRDGTPTVLTSNIYENMNLLGPQSNAEQRFEQYAYMLGGMTEYWRAYRNHAGVLYLAYLDGDLPTCFTCDNFCDVQKLKLEPHFEYYMSEAFKPLGVYINFWQSSLQVGDKRRYRVMIINDEQNSASGKLELYWHCEDRTQEPIIATRSYEIAPLGQMTYDLELTSPTAPGNYTLIAKAYWDGKPWSPTIARRKVQIVIPTNTK